MGLLVAVAACGLADEVAASVGVRVLVAVPGTSVGLIVGLTATINVDAAVAVAEAGIALAVALDSGVAVLIPVGTSLAICVAVPVSVWLGTSVGG